MKNLFTLCACALFSLTLSAQSEQPAGSWYLGSGDATSLLNIFSSGVDISPTVGYAVADDIVVSTAISGSTEDLNLNLAASYFMGDNFVVAGAWDLAGDLDLSIGVGTYIDFKDVLYITPQLNYVFGLPDASMDNLGVSIGFGTRF